MSFAKKLFLLCIFITSYYNNTLGACEPSNKRYEYDFCTYEPYHPDPLEFVTRIEVRPLVNESTTLEEKPQTCREVRFQSVPPASQSAPSQGLGYVDAHAKNLARKSHLNLNHRSEEPKPFKPRVYTKMQLNGDTVALTAALRNLEKKIKDRWWPCFGTRRQIAEIKRILSSPVTHYLSALRTDNLALVKAKIERLGFDISRGLYGEKQWVYSMTYQAAINIYAERCEQALIQEENNRKQAALAHEKKIALEAAAAQKLAAQKEIELAKQQLLVQAKKTIHTLERENVYEQIDDIEACYHELFTSDIAYNPAPPEVDQKIACERAHESFAEREEFGQEGKQRIPDRQALEQEKQALLKQAKRTIHTLEREELYCQADAIEARIQALALEATAFNDSQPMVLHSGIILPDSSHGLPALSGHEPVDYNHEPVDYNVDYNSDYAYQFDAIMTHACQANLATHEHELFGVNNNQPMVIPADLTFDHEDIPLGARAFVARNHDYLYDSVLTHAYLDNCTIDPEFNNKIVRVICEGLKEAGYAFKSKAFNPYEAIETYKELGESLLSLAKGAFHLAMARDIYVISDGKYRMSHAELREHAELVINAIKEMDPFAFSAKQVGEFAGTEAAKMVHTFGLGKIISVVSKVNMASKARSLVKKLDQVTHAAQAERAVAVTAEGVAVHAAHDARAGLVLSDINSASQAEKRVAQAAAGVAQEGMIPQNAVRPLDYGHSAIQYEQLKKALQVEEFTSIIDVSKHGLERLISRGFEPSEIVSLVTKPDYIKMQSDGAKAFIKQLANHKYNIMIINEKTGKVVTALRGTSLKKIVNLGNNYGWSL